MTTSKRQRRLRRQERRKTARLQANHVDVFHAIDAESSVTLQAAEGEGADAIRKFRMTAYKGGRLFVASFFHPVVVDLTGLKAKRKNYPSLLQHDPNRIVGHTTNHTVEATRITAEGVFSGPTEVVTGVLQSSQNGFPWQASIGLRFDHSTVEFVRPGEKVEANGRTFWGPINVIRSSVLNEISFVPSGADEDEATARLAASAKPKGAGAMNFQQWLEARGLDSSTLSEDQLNVLKAAFEAEQQLQASGSNTQETQQSSANNAAQAGQRGAIAAAAQLVAANTQQLSAAAGAGDTDPLVAERRARAGEIERCRRIGEICAQYSNPMFQVQGQSIALEAHAISEGWTLERTELEAMRESRGRAPAGHSRGQESACTLEAMQGASLLASGVPLDYAGFRSMAAEAMGLPAWLRRPINDETRQRYMEAAHRFAQMSSLDICREAIRLDGRMVPSGRTELLNAAFSGGALVSIWTTNVNAQLLQKFQEIADSTVGWCQERDVPDFRLNERARVSKGGRLDKHARGGSANHHSGSDSKEEYRIARYSKQFFKDEMDVIDDRLMAGPEVIDEMAKAAARLRPDLVYAILMGNPLMRDGKALFHADHNNFDSSSATLDETHLKEAITRMWLQRENGVNLNFAPTHLITAATLNFTAKQLLRSAEVNGTSGGTFNPLQNAVAEHRSDSRIDNGVVDPASGVTIAGDPTTSFLISTQGPTIEVGYLRGSGRVPQVTTWKKAGEDGIWGLGASVKMDVGAKALAWETMQRFEA